MNEKNEILVTKKITLSAWLFIAAAMLFVATVLLAYENKGYMGWEKAVFDWINGWPNGLRPFFLLFTLAPESLWIGAAVVIVAFAARLYRLTWRLAVGIVGSTGVVFLAKHLIDRARPAEVLTDAHIRVHETGAGFPSGHSTIITVVMLMLWPYLPKKLRWTVPVMIVLMMLSRIYLGVHAPLDVIGGFALGLGTVCFLNILPTRIKQIAKLN